MLNVTVLLALDFLFDSKSVLVEATLQEELEVISLGDDGVPGGRDPSGW